MVAFSKLINSNILWNRNVPRLLRFLATYFFSVPSQFVLSIQNCNALIIYTFRCGEHDDHPARKQATLLLHILTVCPGKERLQVYPLEPLFVYVCTALVSEEEQICLEPDNSLKPFVSVTGRHFLFRILRQ